MSLGMHRSVLHKAAMYDAGRWREEWVLSFRRCAPGCAGVGEACAAVVALGASAKCSTGLTRACSFPRLIRVRDDKSPEDATSATQVAEMFRNQAVIRQQQVGATGTGLDVRRVQVPYTIAAPSSTNGRRTDMKNSAE